MYKSVLCHLHSSFNGRASIGGFCYEVSRFGVDAIWLSDHDTRIVDQGAAGGYTHDFSRATFVPELDDRGKAVNEFWADSDVTAPVWQAAAEPTEGRVQLQTENKGPEWAGGSVGLKAKGIKHPFFTQPTIQVALDTDIAKQDSQKRFVLTLLLSQAPPTHEQVAMHYVWGSTEGLDNAVAMPLVDGRAELVPWEDAEALGLGQDHTICDVVFRLEARQGGSASAALSGFAIQPEITDQWELQQAQLDLGQEVGKEYGVAVFGSYEISRGERHMTFFGPMSPIFAYEGDVRPSIEELSAFAEQHGGVVSYNHPFSGYKRQDISGEAERRALADELAASLAERGGASVRLMEVGFPQERHGFEPADYRYLWDVLNNKGLRIGGVTVSDAHANVVWDTGQNFANYVAVSECTAESFAAGMRAQNFFMAEAASYQGGFSFATQTGQTMGETAAGGVAELSLQGLPEGSRVTWVLDGKNVKTDVVSGDYNGSLDLTEGKRFVRVEVERADGRLLLLTNPIWLEPK